jgi:Protein of unknown function (DUF3987)
VTNSTYEKMKAQQEAREAEEPHVLTPIPAFPIGVLPDSAKGLVKSVGVPPALTAGAALAAAATAIGGEAEIAVNNSFIRRPIVWVPQIAPTGAGKSPALEAAYRPLDEWQDERPPIEVPGKKKGETEVIDPPELTVSDCTLESLARDLDVNQSTGIKVDELSQLLRGLGEYKGGSGDRGRFLKLWTGSRWVYRRVGSGGKAGNAVKLTIKKPTVSICGGLQTALHHLLGAEDDGQRERWLPHLAPRGQLSRGTGNAEAWRAVIRDLLDNQEIPRKWTLSPKAYTLWSTTDDRWKAEGKHTSNSTALNGVMQKLGLQVLVVALVLAELDDPVTSRTLLVSEDAMSRAITWVTFSLDCWRALPEAGGLALSYRIKELDGAVDKIVAWLDEHTPVARKSQLLSAHVGGVRTAGEMSEVVDRYKEVHPGCVWTQPANAQGGRPGTIICSPRLPLNKRGGFLARQETP